MPGIDAPARVYAAAYAAVRGERGRTAEAAMAEARAAVDDFLKHCSGRTR